MFAVISHNGNQHRFTLDKEYDLDLGKDIAETEKKMTFSDVLLFSDDKNVVVGEPYIKGASVEVEILKTGLGEKSSSLKFHAKKRYTRHLGHRQASTRIKIVKIALKNEK